MEESFNVETNDTVENTEVSPQPTVESSSVPEIPTLEPTIVYESIDNTNLELLITELNSSVVQLNEQVAYINTSILFTIGISCSVFVLILLYKFIRSFL